MHEAERLNLLPDLKEQRSMQVMQPAHLAGSTSINRLPFMTLTVMIYACEKKPAGLQHHFYPVGLGKPWM